MEDTVVRLRDRIKVLERELAEARAENKDILRWWKEELDQAEQQRDRLASYAKHYADCNLLMGECSCGLDAALAGGEGG